MNKLRETLKGAWTCFNVPAACIGFAIGVVIFGFCGIWHGMVIGFESADQWMGRE